ncbi:S8 family serine peptidase [Planctomycetaceae bacterium]|nr:S8 family serine peptidase [Planctomycetaceae bacterium]
MASSRRTRRRRQQRSFQRHQLRLEGLEKRYALDAASLLDPSSYEPGSLLIKLNGEVAESSLSSLSSGTTAGGASSSAVNSVDVLSSLPTTVADVLSEFGANGVRHLFPSASTPLQDNANFGIDRWLRIDLPEVTDIEAVTARLEGDPSISAVEPEIRYRLVNSSNGDFGPTSGGDTRDISTTSQSNGGISTNNTNNWHLNVVNAPEAWSYLTNQGLPAGGASDVVVAVIDTGVDYFHEDLAANMWVNTQEIPGNGLDDDANGVIDDIHGANFVGSSHYHSGDPMDDHLHGTHVSGIIAAADNGIGVTGIAHNTKIMAIKALDYLSYGTATDFAEAIYYAVENGADIINMSMGSFHDSNLVRDALQVADQKCVLIAAAGNKGLDNESLPFYPASHNWVLGVQATAPSPNSFGNYRPWFSNYDGAAGGVREYEVAAPGVDIYSTVPNDGYIALDGTSMAAPIVSGIASLLRTKFADKDAYSTKFIMGQLQTGGINGGEHISQNEIIDAYRVLTDTPHPDISYVEHWLINEPQSGGVDDDGIILAGDTANLAVRLKNRWGAAENVQVTLEAVALDTGLPDPYVTVDAGTVNYGTIDSYAQGDNGLVYDGNGDVSGVTSPFTVTVASDIPNEYEVPFRLTISAENGIDAFDNTTYQFEQRFSVTARRGGVLPSIISQDMTLTKEHLWVVDGPVLVPAGVTLRVDPGTHVQWGTTEPRDPNVQQRLPYIKVEGTMVVQGSAEDPVQLYPSKLFREQSENINSLSEFSANVRIFNTGGTATIEHAVIQSPEFGQAYGDGVLHEGFSRLTSIKKSLILPGLSGHDRSSRLYWDSSENTYKTRSPNAAGCYSFAASRIEETRIYIANSSDLYPDYYRGLPEDNFIGPSAWAPITIEFDTVLFEAMDVRTNQSWNAGFNGLTSNSVFFGQNFDPNGHIYVFNSAPYVGATQVDAQEGARFSNNAILNALWSSDQQNWLRIKSNISRDEVGYLGGNYWGTDDQATLSQLKIDQEDDFNRGQLILDPVASIPNTNTYPFVTNVQVLDSSLASVTTVGPELATFEVSFNRDMNTAIQPEVSFGATATANDYSITGSWQDARTWVGTYNITPMTSEGHQLIRVKDAQAAGKPWLVTGNDAGRFRFEIISTNAQAMNLQASGGENKVDLSWVQDDFDLLAGFNVYRSTSLSGTYERINSTVIPVDTKSYADTSAEPAVTYFYKFRVVTTDGNESGDSNITSATPLDTIPPQINHSPVGSAAPNFDFTIRADVTDNLQVDAVQLNYRSLGAADFSQVVMTHTTANKYSATLEASVMAAPGIEYFISATDGITTVYNGLAASPFMITVDDNPAVTSITPATGPVAGGTSVTIVGSNFKAGATVTIGGAPADDVVVVNSNQITATTPARFAASADVRVINTDLAVGDLLNGFTYVSDGVVVSMPSATANVGGTVEVPVSLSNVAGMLSAEVTISFDQTVLGAQSVRSGALASGWALEANTATPGQVVITAASATPVSATGVLAYVTFNVVGDALSSTPLAISSVSLNDGAITTETANGSLVVNDVFSIGGTVRYFTDSLPVSGTTLSINNTSNAVTTTTTSADGTFVFGGLNRDGYVLSASKGDEVAEISAFDASLVLRNAAGLISLSSNQQLAADVNRNGSVSALDASYILQKSVGLIAGQFPGAGKYWDFLPAERTYADLSSDRTGQDFTAVLIGDVSGNWGSLGAQGGFSISGIDSTQSIAPNSTVTLTLETLDILPGTSLPLPLVLSRGTEEIYSLDALIEYDPASVSITQSDVTAGANDGSMFVVANIIQPGQLRLAIASSQSLPDQQAIATLNFTVNALADVTPITVKTASLDEGRVASATVEGGFAALQPIENDGQVRLSRNRNGLFYANNKRLKFRGQPVQAQLAAWSLLGAETVQGKNIAFVRHDSGAQHRWSLDSEWSFGDPFTAISNAATLQLPASAREVTTTFNVVAVSGAYAINGVNNPTLTVRRGLTYTFNLNTAGHPFYLQTTGGGYQSANVYSNGFTGNIQTTGEHQWVVPQDAPDEIFYQCEFHPVMFGKIIVVD